MFEQQQAADPAGTHGTTVINSFGGTSLRSKLQLDLRNWNDDEFPISKLDSGQFDKQIADTFLTDLTWPFKQSSLLGLEHGGNLASKLLNRNIFAAPRRVVSSKCRRSTYVSRV